MRVVSDESAHIFELVAHSTAHGDSSLDVDVDVHSRGGGGWVCGRGENFGSRRQEQAIYIIKYTRTRARSNNTPPVPSILPCSHFAA